MNYVEKTNVAIPERKAGERFASEAERKTGLPRDTDLDDAVVDPRRRDQLKREWCAVTWRSEFYDAVENYSISYAYQLLAASRKIDSPFFADIKEDFLAFLDECERGGLARLTKMHMAWLVSLRADVAEERFVAPASMVAQLDRFGHEVGAEEGLKFDKKLSRAMPAIKEEVLLNAFWGGLRRGGIDDFIGAFYQLKQAKEWKMEEYAGMRRALLTVLDQELVKSPEEHEMALRSEIERMRRLVNAW